VDKDTDERGQEEGGREEDSEFEFPAEDSETDSDFEADMSPDEEAVAMKSSPIITFSHITELCKFSIRGLAARI
jgi:hypothetical protein